MNLATRFGLLLGRVAKSSRVTRRERHALMGIYNSVYRNGHPVDAWVWTWSANPFNSISFFKKILAGLEAKGLVAEEHELVCLTQEGWKVLKQSLAIEIILKAAA